MSVVKRALRTLKIPDVTALSDALSLADSHKLVWVTVCLAGGCLLHEVVMTSFLPLDLAGIEVCACLSSLLRQLSLCFGLLAGLASLIASEAENRRADHIMLAEPLYPCRTGRPLVFVVPKDRESWLIQLPEEANGVIPLFLSNLQT